ncbi:FkbM family methyltransferase [Nodularia harveyana UHCC-0300]|uniref:FkbM family methyltransferase n=1 Tax=Nodularia harveyana UHCC-0300 TaxID=2974287 RepID=A0ABU5UII0_9CYAN|nr:FkbM family methyltransferase [Nodularia harveyana]MEA5583279.1 FkbM family methyltransferase [Nodularia harveyana UHCC-0300]
MLKKQIKKFLQASGYTLYQTKKMPFGCDLKADIARISPDLTLKTIFDVGANKGQTTLNYRRKFPEAHIFAFEPVNQTFAVLKTNVGADSHVSCFNLALGEENKQEKMLVAGTSGSNSISSGSQVNSQPNQSLETVNIMTLDQFMVENDHKIDQIDLLKIDTEGYECQVLRGAEATLRSGKILYISIEVTFRPQDNHHTQFSTISEILADYNFNFVGLYDVNPFWGGGNAVDYCNALFKCWEKGKNLKLWEQ